MRNSCTKKSQSSAKMPMFATSPGASVPVLGLADRFVSVSGMNSYVIGS